MIAERNRRQRRKPRRTGGGATGPCVASLGEYAGGDRLIAFQRGELNATKDGITGTPVKAEEWGLDTTGNWDAFLQKTSGTTDLDQGRTHNPVNEITAITATTGTNWADPVHDRAGNMTTIPKPANLADGLTATYDAWNRLVEVKDGQTVIARYDYDGLNRRIKSHLDSGAPSNPTGIDTHVHYYHNSAWQILETRQSDTESAQPEALQPKHQYVWSQRYIDAAVLRDENTSANGLCDDQRLYFLNDANFNVTALLDTAGDAVERYVYSPYGVVTIYDPTWTNTRSASSHANVTLYTGRELDGETGLYYYRNRYYIPGLGGFATRDLIRYVSGMSLYAYASRSPANLRDPLGLQPAPSQQQWGLWTPWQEAAVGTTWTTREYADFNDPFGEDVTHIYTIIIPYRESCGPDGLTPQLDVGPTRATSTVLPYFSLLVMSAGVSHRLVGERAGSFPCPPGQVGSILRWEKDFEIYEWVELGLAIPPRTWPWRLEWPVRGRVTWTHQVVCCCRP